MLRHIQAADALRTKMKEDNISTLKSIGVDPAVAYDVARAFMTQPYIRQVGMQVIVLDIYIEQLNEVNEEVSKGNPEVDPKRVFLWALTSMSHRHPEEFATTFQMAGQTFYQLFGEAM